MSHPLREHLLPATKEKMCIGEFVDFFLLLYRKPEKDKQDLDKKEKEILKCRKVQLGGWSLDFCRCYCHDAALEGHAILLYFDMIYKVFTGFSGHA